MRKVTSLFFFGLMTVVLAAALLLSLHSGQASPAPDAHNFERANQLYATGQYAEAVSVYQSLIDQGYGGASLHFNLGNAHYSLGDLGWAIYHYEQATRLSPRDADIRANLNLARQETVDQLQAGDAGPLSDWLHAFDAWLNLSEMALLALLLFWLAAGLWIGYRHADQTRLRRGLGYAWIGTVCILLIVGLGMGGRSYQQATQPQAIVIVEGVDVRSTPGDGAIIFTLHAGSKINLQATAGQWVQLSLPGEQIQGWLPLDSIAKLE